MTRCKSRFISIVIPTFNRAQLLDGVLSSIPKNDEIEVVIVDDGSTDGTYDIIHKKHNSRLDINYIYQHNQGRAHALNKAILKASSEFIMIMDDDDYLVMGWFDIIQKRLKSIRMKEINAMIFTCLDGKNKLIGKRFLVEGESSYLDDFINQKNSGDRKEVVKSKLIQPIAESLNTILDVNTRRVPTSLYWVLALKNKEVFKFNDALIVKSYLDDGMTKNILKSRVESCQMSHYYYEKILEINNLNIFIKFKSLVNFGRFLFHCDHSFFKVFAQVGLFTLASITVYFLDIMKLKLTRQL
jgi:glycosyltransferase involved in cell wall biosynthesis